MKKFHLASDDMKRKLRRALIIGVGILALGATEAQAQNGVWGKLKSMNDKIAAKVDDVSAKRFQVERTAYNLDQLDQVSGRLVSKGLGAVVQGVANKIASTKARKQAVAQEAAAFTEAQSVGQYQTIQHTETEQQVPQTRSQTQTEEQSSVRETHTQRTSATPKSGTVRQVSLDELVKMAQARKSK